MEIGATQWYDTNPKVRHMANIFSKKRTITLRATIEISYLRSFLRSEKPLGWKDDDKILKDVYLTGRFWDSYETNIKITKHEIRALELSLIELLKSCGVQYADWVHWGLTSQDIMDAVYVKQIRLASFELINWAHDIKKSFNNIAKCNKLIMGMTHGQPATPTTLGSQIKIYTNRINNCIDFFLSISLSTKFSGSNGACFSHNNIDLQGRKKTFEFLKKDQSMTILPNATQVNSNDDKAELFHGYIRLNNVLIDLCRDFWYYVSRNLVTVVREDGYAGSSIMAHKNNPIELENAEGNLEYVNSQLSFFSDKLTKSRMQRDLSDSTVQKDYGTLFARMTIAYHNISTIFSKMVVNDWNLECAGEEIRHNHQIFVELLISYIKFHHKDHTIYEFIKKEVHSGGILDVGNFRNLCTKLSQKYNDPKIMELCVKIIKGELAV